MSNDYLQASTEKRVPPGMPDDEISLADVIAFLRQNLLWIVLGFLVCVSATGAYAFLTKPLYRAEVVVRQAERGGKGAGAALAGRLGGLASLAGIGMTEGGGSNDALAILNSHRLIEEFVRLKSLEAVLGPDPSKPTSVWKAARLFKVKVLEVKDDKRTNLVTVAVTWRDPVQAAEWANGLVQLTNEILRTRDKADAERSLEFLHAELKKTNVVEMHAALYGLIENETKSLMMADGRVDYALVVLDPAVKPERRSSPQRLQLMAIGAIVGVIAGIVLALLVAALGQQRRRG